MARQKTNRSAYEWMLGLSAEGWAWEFLRRSPDYKKDYLAFACIESCAAKQIAARWGLLQLVDPDLDARSAAVFWSPTYNRSVLPLVAAGDGHANGLSAVKCKVAILQSADHRHVLYSCEGRFLQLAVTGDGALGSARFMTDALPEDHRDNKLIALRRFADLVRHKRLRPHLYGQQRRGPRLAHLAEILDSYARNPAHREIARDVFGKERADEEWDNLRDHVRRAVAAGQKLTQRGYLGLLD